MKPYHSPLLCGIIAFISIVQMSPAEIAVNSPSLAQRGKFIEFDRGQFVRASAILGISGEIELIAYPMDDRDVHSNKAESEFPLSLAGIKELKDADRSALIKECGRPEDTVKDFGFAVFVSIHVNIGGDYRRLRLIETEGKDPSESWEEHEKALKAAVAVLDRLIVLASGSEGDGAGQSGTAPESDGK